MNKKLIVLILLSIIGFAVYYNSIQNGFYLDDIHHIVNNKYIKSLTNIPRFFIDTSTFSAYSERGHYRPLLLVTHALNYAVGGLSPVGYHLVNLSFHIGSAFLTYLILQAMLDSKQLEGKSAHSPQLTANYLASVAAGLIFLVHPFNTEVINYISARSSVMSGFFYLLAFWWWIKFRSKQLPVIASEATQSEKGIASGILSPRNDNRKVFYIASLLAFIAGMLTKEVVITLPVMLWLYDLYGFNKVSSKQLAVSGKQLADKTVYRSRLTASYLLNWRTFVPYIPFLLIVAVLYVLLRIFSYGRIVPNFQRDIFTQIFTVIPVLVKHWQMFIIPIPLTMAHSVEINKTFWSFQVIHSALILIISVAIAILLSIIRSRPWRVVSFFLLWFFIVIMPVMIIPLNAIFQENRGYVAIVSFAVLVGVIVGELWKIGLRKVSIGVLVLITLVYASGVVKRNMVWRDDVTLWSDAVLKAPDIPITHISLGSAYRKAGMNEQAIKAYRNARAVGGPKYPNARYKLAQVYIEQERWDLAAPELEEAKEILLNAPDQRSELGSIYTDLEMVYHKSGKLELAESVHKEAEEHLR